MGVIASASPPPAPGFAFPSASAAAGVASPPATAGDRARPRLPPSLAATTSRSGPASPLGPRRGARVPAPGRSSRTTAGRREEARIDRPPRPQLLARPDPVASRELARRLARVALGVPVGAVREEDPHHFHVTVVAGPVHCRVFGGSTTSRLSSRREPRGHARDARGTHADSTLGSS